MISKQGKGKIYVLIFGILDSISIFILFSLALVIFSNESKDDAIDLCI